MALYSKITLYMSHLGSTANKLFPNSTRSRGLLGDTSLAWPCWCNWIAQRFICSNRPYSPSRTQRWKLPFTAPPLPSMPSVAWMYPGRLVATFTSQLSSVALPPNLHVNSASRSRQSEKRGRGGSVIKSELTESRVIEGGETLVIFFFGKMSPFLPSGSQPGHETKKKRRKKPLSCAMTVTARGEKSLWAYSQPLLHYQLQIMNVLHTVWFSLPYSIMLCRHHSKWGPRGTPSGTLGFLVALSPLLANAVALLLQVAVIALTFGGLLLS